MAEQRQYLPNPERREFIRYYSKMVASAITAGTLLSCLPFQPDPSRPRTRSTQLFPSLTYRQLEKLIKVFGNYNKITKGWDLVYGPSILRSKYGFNDFKGHEDYGEAGGVDYDVSSGTPLTTVSKSYLFGTHYGNGLALGLQNYFHFHKKDYFHKKGRVTKRIKMVYGHLSDYVGWKANEQYFKRPIDEWIITNRGLAVALSGNSSNTGPIPDHLHFGLATGPPRQKPTKHIDPEKFGPDKDKLVFWDGVANLDMGDIEKKLALEDILSGAESRLDKWLSQAKETKDTRLEELAGNSLEFYRLLGTNEWKKVIDSPHFHDMREYLKKHCFGIPKGPDREGRNISTGEIALQNPEIQRFGPGTDAYSLALAVIGYSSLDQPVILTLPFISPAFAKQYLDELLMLKQEMGLSGMSKPKPKPRPMQIETGTGEINLK